MYISCPSCSTSFSVSGSDIGTGGQMVRCFNCSHSWHQYPLPPQAQAQYVPVQYVPPGQFSAPPQVSNVGVSQPQYMPSPQGVSYTLPPGQGPVPQPVTAPIPEPIPEPIP
ncbi:MAG TPA: hypothetical protein EYQ26_10715, partial [Rhodospirillales bacterium]|nr:hypothetical protein [Rhodospirillales bacterium]